jgi:hypothetical protein
MPTVITANTKPTPEEKWFPIAFPEMNKMFCTNFLCYFGYFVSFRLIEIDTVNMYPMGLPINNSCALLIIATFVLFIIPVSGLCNNNCAYTYDGQCDDGGINAEYLDCDFGSDCYDCGTRNVGDAYIVPFSSKTCATELTKTECQDAAMAAQMAFVATSRAGPANCFSDQTTFYFNPGVDNNRYCSDNQYCFCKYNPSTFSTRSTTGRKSTSSNGECELGFRYNDVGDECSECSVGTYTKTKHDTRCLYCECYEEKEYYENLAILKRENYSQYESTVNPADDQCYRYCLYPYKERYYDSVTAIFWIIVIAIVLCCGCCCIRRCRNKAKRGRQMVHMPDASRTQRMVYGQNHLQANNGMHYASRIELIKTNPGAHASKTVAAEEIKVETEAAIAEENVELHTKEAPTPSSDQAPKTEALGENNSTEDQASKTVADSKEVPASSSETEVAKEAPAKTKAMENSDSTQKQVLNTVAAGKHANANTELAAQSPKEKNGKLHAKEEPGQTPKAASMEKNAAKTASVAANAPEAKSVEDTGGDINLLKMDFYCISICHEEKSNTATGFVKSINHRALRDEAVYIDQINHSCVKEVKNSNDLAQDLIWMKSPSVISYKTIKKEKLPISLREDMVLIRICLESAAIFQSISFNYNLQIEKINGDYKNLFTPLMAGDSLVKINEYVIEGYVKPSYSVFFQRLLAENKEMTVVFRRDFGSRTGSAKPNKSLLFPCNAPVGIGLEDFLRLGKSRTGSTSMKDILPTITGYRATGTHYIMFAPTSPIQYVIEAIEEAFHYYSPEDKKTVFLFFDSISQNQVCNMYVNTGTPSLLVYDPFSPRESPFDCQVCVANMVSSIQGKKNISFRIVVSPEAYQKLNDCFRSNSIDDILHEILRLGASNAQFSYAELACVRKAFFHWLLLALHVLAWERGDSYLFSTGNVKLQEVQAKVFHAAGLYRYAELQYTRALKDYGVYKSESEEPNQMHSILSKMLSSLRTKSSFTDEVLAVRKQKRLRRHSSFAIEREATGDEDVSFWERVGKLNCASNYAILLQDRGHTQLAADLLEGIIAVWGGEAPKWLARHQVSKLLGKQEKPNSGQKFIYFESKHRRKLKILFSQNAAELSPLAYCCCCFPLLNYWLHLLFFLVGWLLMPILYVCMHSSDKEKIQKRKSYIESISGTADEEKGQCVRRTYESVGLSDCMKMFDGLAFKADPEDPRELLDNDVPDDLYLKYQFGFVSTVTERKRAWISKCNHVANRFAADCVQSVYSLVVFALTLVGLAFTLVTKFKTRASCCPKLWCYLCCRTCVTPKGDRFSDAEIEAAERREKLLEQRIAQIEAERKIQERERKKNESFGKQLALGVAGTAASVAVELLLS